MKGTSAAGKRLRQSAAQVLALARGAIRRGAAGGEWLLLRRGSAAPDFARGFPEDRGGDEKGDQGQPRLREDDRPARGSHRARVSGGLKNGQPHREDRARAFAARGARTDAHHGRGVHAAALIRRSVRIVSWLLQFVCSRAVRRSVTSRNSRADFAERRTGAWPSTSLRP